jgi:hypothetical protein
VRLREQLADSYVQGGDGMQLPPSAALGDFGKEFQQRRAAGSEASKSMTAPKLQVYSDLFEAIIEADEAFAPLLRKVKDIYDASAEPWLQQGGPQGKIAAQRQDADGEEDPGFSEVVEVEDVHTGPGDTDKLVELGLENRLLRTMAGALHREREEIRAEKEAAEARKKQKHFIPEPEEGDDWAKLAGLLPLGGGLACQDWLRRKTSNARPFSAMRITSNGVRTDQVW